MEQMQKPHFNGRGFTSIITGLSFLGLAFTGGVLFFMPPGRIANWSGWTSMGLSKSQWGGLHIWFGMLLLVAGLVHIYFNWKCLLGYFMDRARQHLAWRNEWLVSVGLFVLISLGTVMGLPPFSSFLNWHESIKHGYDQSPAQAPLAHAELLTLKELADQVDGLDLDSMKANLKRHGIAADSPDQTIADLAEVSGMTPHEVYSLACGNQVGTNTGQRGYRGGHSAQQPGPTGMQAGTGRQGGSKGFGQMTLSEYCKQANIDSTSALGILKQAGFEASQAMTMREIADAANVHPSEVRQLLE